MRAVEGLPALPGEKATLTALARCVLSAGRMAIGRSSHSCLQDFWIPRYVRWGGLDNVSGPLAKLASPKPASRFVDESLANEGSLAGLRGAVMFRTHSMTSSLLCVSIFV